jgi:hypothetical protein
MVEEAVDKGVVLAFDSAGVKGGEKEISSEKVCGLLLLELNPILLAERVELEMERDNSSRNKLGF